MPNNLTGSQVMRIAAALHVYGRRLTGPTWIAMQKAEPNEILGFAQGQNEARALIPSGLSSTYDTFGPYDPPTYPPFDNRLNVRSHDCCTGGQLNAASPGAFGELPMISDMTSVQLTVNWTAGGAGKTAVFTIFDGTNPALPRPDTIFLSRASSEAFMYPRYEHMFGTRIVNLLRTKLGDL
jgi:hypothetical protein